MLGTFLTRTLILALGYAYPAYECFKTVEKNKPDIERLRFWCQYWILIAALSVFERIGDIFISWLPMYGEVKLVFYIYLWYPKTRGTSYVYETFFRPYIQRHESEIDRTLLELRTRAADFAVSYCHKAMTYGQTRFFEVLQFIASQKQSQSRKTHQPNEQTHQPSPGANVNDSVMDEAIRLNRARMRKTNHINNSSEDVS
ncbi:Receptor expression-enhancing protein 3 [Zostera marina]|uniref:HVA22-like protein n=1 Tax=Zostera marina TaxID=29655 RepID=A0A0K9PMT0_ZOSMR|nr:Receptor expression-enhancing protein 3 [Zostera marina]